MDKAQKRSGVLILRIFQMESQGRMSQRRSQQWQGYGDRAGLHHQEVGRNSQTPGVPPTILQHCSVLETHPSAIRSNVKLWEVIAYNNISNLIHISKLFLWFAWSSWPHRVTHAPA